MARRATLWWYALGALVILAACTEGADGAPPEPAAATPTEVSTPTQTDTATASPKSEVTPPSPEAGPSPTPQGSPEPTATDQPTVSPTPSETVSPEPTPTPDATPTTEAPEPRPEWLGTRPLEEGPDGIAPAQNTPEELIDRQLPPPDPPLLEPPEDDAFNAEITQVPDDVLERSTWTQECPVGVEELRYITVSFWGFDDQAHTGELLIHAEAADDMVGVFEQLFHERFPIEEMRVASTEEVDAPPTGDGNVTTGFVCRPLTGGSDDWSQHAYGLAVDINPFHNPYERGEQVVPELATAYTDRNDERPGMIADGDIVVEAFTDIGWGWGGHWDSLTDPMHFSQSGR